MKISELFLHIKTNETDSSVLFHHWMFWTKKDGNAETHKLKENVIIILYSTEM